MIVREKAPAPSAFIEISNGSVVGVDTSRRASSLRDWFVKKRTLSAQNIPILRNINFKAVPGDRVGIIGINGSGKSSLLKVVTGNYPLTSGTLRVRGSMFPLIEMGAGFEPELTGRQNIRLSFAIRGRLHEFSYEKEQQIIDIAEIGKKIDLPLKNYSSGMIARLAFSSAIVSNSDILLLDEALATGDAGFQHKSAEMLNSKIDKASITLVVSHSMDEIVSICNRFVLIHNGQIVSDAASCEVVNQYKEEILGI